MFAGNKYADLSETCLYYIGGILKHAKAINAFTNPTTNSYKRLVPGYEAPVLLAYSARNRSASCRIPHVTSPKAKRIEVRFPDPAANPYLAFAAMLMAGLDGIQNKIHPGEPMDKNLYDLPPAELAKIPTVCGSLREALDSLDKDREFLKKGGVFTDDMIDAYIELKMAEVDALRDDAASGRVRHVLLGVSVSRRKPDIEKPGSVPGFFVTARGLGSLTVANSDCCPHRSLDRHGPGLLASRQTAHGLPRQSDPALFPPEQPHRHKTCFRARQMADLLYSERLKAHGSRSSLQCDTGCTVAFIVETCRVDTGGLSTPVQLPVDL